MVEKASDLGNVLYMVTDPAHILYGRLVTAEMPKYADCVELWVYDENGSRYLACFGLLEFIGIIDDALNVLEHMPWRQKQEKSWYLT